MNQVSLIGNMGQDPELRTTNSGKSVANFSIAVRSWRTDQQGNNQTDWFRVTVWGKVAENVANYCKKGSKVGVSGELQTNKYTNNDGQEVTSVEINARQVDFLDPRNSNSNNNQNNHNQNNQQNNYQQNNQNQANDPFEKNDNSIEISNQDLPF